MLDDEDIFLPQSPTPANRRSVGRGNRATRARLNRGGQSSRGGRTHATVIDAEAGNLIQNEAQTSALELSK